MAKAVRIELDTTRYRTPTVSEIRAAKDYILRRSDVADEAWDIASDYIMEAVEKLVRIAYKYNIPPEQFAFDSSVNQDMMDEVSAVMEDLDDDIYELLRSRALSCTKNEESRSWLLALMLTLGHRNMSLRETLYSYEWRMLQQVGALVSSDKYNNVPVEQSVVNTTHYIGKVTQSPSFVKTTKYRELFASAIIRTGGKTTFPDGSPNVQGVPVDGYNAIKQVYGGVIAHVWMKNQLVEMLNNGCVGYYQLRGSEYPCAVCDDEVGFHEGIDINDEPFPHMNCYCYRVPVYANGQQGEAVINYE